MHSVLLVDDETIVRTSLASVLDWEEEGFTIVGSVANGRAALNVLQSEHIDVLFTDIKMPIMDGLALIEQVSRMKAPPVIIVLSAYSEFDLVRKAFLLGARDYILKSDITAAYIEDVLHAIRPLLDHSGKRLANNGNGAATQGGILRRLAFGNMDGAEDFLPDTWALACLEIDNFVAESLRFGSNLATALAQPLVDFAHQVPRIASKCVITSLSFSRYLILLKGKDTADQARSICSQVQKVWKDYMNIATTGGVSQIGHEPAMFPQLLQETFSNITLKCIFGSGGIFMPAEAQLFDIRLALQLRPQLDSLLEGMRSMKAQHLIESQQEVFALLRQGDLARTKTLALQIVYNIEVMLLDAGVDLWSVFNTENEIDFYQKVSGLESQRDVELWLTGVIRWVSDYYDNTQVSAEIDIMEKAKHFIADHYIDPELNLAAVAGFVGLNEKYFSSRFNKEVGCSFVSYLTELRIAHAKQLILKTDMRMYEVSEAVGFANVEHFTRVFKKTVGVSPKSYHGDTA